MSLIQLAHCPEMWVVYNYGYVQHLYPISVRNQNNSISTDLLMIVFSLRLRMHFLFEQKLSASVCTQSKQMS